MYFIKIGNTIIESSSSYKRLYALYCRICLAVPDCSFLQRDRVLEQRVDGVIHIG